MAPTTEEITAHNPGFVLYSGCGWNGEETTDYDEPVDPEIIQAAGRILACLDQGNCCGSCQTLVLNTVRFSMQSAAQARMAGSFMVARLALSLGTVLRELYVLDGAAQELIRRHLRLILAIGHSGSRTDGQFRRSFGERQAAIEDQILKLEQEAELYCAPALSASCPNQAGGRHGNERGN